MNTDAALGIIIWIGSTLFAGGVSLAGLIFTDFGKRFIGQVFDERLATFEHQLDHRLAFLTDRGVRLNEREYDALASAWSWIADAYTAAGEVVWQIVQTPAWDKFSDEEMTRGLGRLGFDEAAVARIMNAADRTVAYSREVQTRDINAAYRAVWKAQKILRRSGIFMEPTLRSDLWEFTRYLRVVLAQSQMERAKRPQYDGFGDEGEKKYQLLEQRVGESLRQGVPPAPAT